MADEHDVGATWLEAVEERHLAELRVSELARAVRALSSVYVRRRTTLTQGAALGSRGKRAAFAVFYGPLHLLVLQHVVRALGAADRMPATIVDLGCGTGSAGAAWALATVDRRPRLIGIDRHPWAVREARWTYERLGLDGSARRADAARVRPPQGSAVVAAYLLNELTAAARASLLDALLDPPASGPGRVLIVEPIAHAVAPWWDGLRERFASAGGRADEWTIGLDLPPLLRKLDRAAGLDHSQLKARSVYLRRD